jgi:hypothetical protein
MQKFTFFEILRIVTEAYLMVYNRSFFEMIRVSTIMLYVFFRYLLRVFYGLLHDERLIRDVRWQWPSLIGNHVCFFSCGSMVEMSFSFDCFFVLVTQV